MKPFPFLGQGDGDERWQVAEDGSVQVVAAEVISSRGACCVAPGQKVKSLCANFRDDHSFVAVRDRDDLLALLQ